MELKQKIGLLRLSDDTSRESIMEAVLREYQNDTQLFDYQDIKKMIEEYHDIHTVEEITKTAIALLTDELLINIESAIPLQTRLFYAEKFDLITKKELREDIKLGNKIAKFVSETENFFSIPNFMVFITEMNAAGCKIGDYNIAALVINDKKIMSLNQMQRTTAPEQLLIKRFDITTGGQLIHAGARLHNAIRKNAENTIRKAKSVEDIKDIYDKDFETWTKEMNGFSAEIENILTYNLVSCTTRY